MPVRAGKSGTQVINRHARVLASLLIAVIICAPAFGRDSCLGKLIPTPKAQDPWEEQKPGEIEKDAFEKEIALDSFDLLCPPVTPSGICLFGEGVTTAHFLEATLYVLRHLRI